MSYLLLMMDYLYMTNSKCLKSEIVNQELIYIYNLSVFWYETHRGSGNHNQGREGEKISKK